MTNVQKYLEVLGFMSEDYAEKLVNKNGKANLIPHLEVMMMDGIAQYYGVSEQILELVYRKYRCIFPKYIQMLTPSDVLDVSVYSQRAKDCGYFKIGFRNGLEVLMPKTGNRGFSIQGVLLLGALLCDDVFDTVGNGNALRVNKSLNEIYNRFFASQNKKQKASKTDEAKEPVSVTVATTVTVSSGKRSRLPKPVVQVSSDGRVISRFNSQSEAARNTGVPQASISMCCLGRMKQAGGFLWRTATV